MLLVQQARNIKVDEDNNKSARLKVILFKFKKTKKFKNTKQIRSRILYFCQTLHLQGGTYFSKSPRL